MFGIHYIKFLPSEYVLRYKSGKIVKEGAGLSFFYYAPVTSLVVLPAASAEAPFIFSEVTGDYQSVTVQGQLTYRITDFRRAAQALNYSIHIGSRKYVSEDPQKLPQRLIGTVQVLTKKYIGKLSVRDAIRSSEALAANLRQEIRAAEEIKAIGVEVMDAAILAIQPTKETARALEAEAREEILRQADDALYARRNASIEQERRVKENELNTDVAVENKRKQIKETQLEAERLVMQKQSQMKDEQLGYETALEKKRQELIGLRTKNARAEADAKAYEVSAMAKAFSGIDPAVLQSLTNAGMKPDKLIALAFQNLADKADKIGQLNITPDLLQDLMKDKESGQK